MAQPDKKDAAGEAITSTFSENPVGSATVPCPAQGRSLDNPESLLGADPEQVEKLVPSDWTKSPTKGEGGIRYADPKARGDQVRVMPGNPRDPNPVKQGPYVRISKHGQVSDPIPLKGNPTLTS